MIMVVTPAPEIALVAKACWQSVVSGDSNFTATKGGSIGFYLKQCIFSKNRLRSFCFKNIYIYMSSH